MVIFNNTSAYIKTKSADALLKMIIILSELYGSAGRLTWQFMETHILQQLPGGNKPALTDFEFHLSKQQTAFLKTSQYL